MIQLAKTFAQNLTGLTSTRVIKFEPKKVDMSRTRLYVSSAETGQNPIRVLDFAESRLRGIDGGLSGLYISGATPNFFRFGESPGATFRSALGNNYRARLFWRPDFLGPLGFIQAGPYGNPAFAFHTLEHGAYDLASGDEGLHMLLSEHTTDAAEKATEFYDHPDMVYARHTVLPLAEVQGTEKDSLLTSEDFMSSAAFFEGYGNDAFSSGTIDRIKNAFQQTEAHTQLVALHTLKFVLVRHKSVLAEDPTRRDREIGKILYSALLRDNVSPKVKNAILAMIEQTLPDSGFMFDDADLNDLAAKYLRGYFNFLGLGGAQLCNFLINTGTLKTQPSD